jgi:hypothetical protein
MLPAVRSHGTVAEKSPQRPAPKIAAGLGSDYFLPAVAAVGPYAGRG